MDKEKEDDIKSAWRDLSFPGSFSGLSTFRQALLHEKGIKISRKQLFDLMKSDSDFIQETRKVRKVKERRHYNTYGVGQLMQSDLGFMPEYNGYKYFLVLVDCFSRRLYCRAMKDKTSRSTQKALEETFEEAKLTPQVLECDAGSEYLGLKDFFKKHKIYFKTKLPPQKAPFAEEAVQDGCI